MATQIDYSKVIQLTHPGSEWSLQDIYDFNSLTWDSINSISKPSLTDLLTQLDLVKPTEAFRLLREKRNAILAHSDMHALPDYPHPNQETKQAWLSYRQALRDLTQHSTPTLSVSLELDEASVVWPLRPSA